MNNCFILNSVSFGAFHCDKYKMRFKYQNIFSPTIKCYKSLEERKNNILGAELLLDFDCLRDAGFDDETLFRMIKYGETADAAIQYASLLLSKEIMFINIERCNLCDNRILKKIVRLNDSLYLAGIQLVVEITERDYCGDCNRVIQGLSYLKSMEVQLACDDFSYADIVLGVNDNELMLFYDYIKLEMPKGKKAVESLNKFIDFYGVKKRIIIERLENKEQVKSLSLENVWGLQGFVFCKGVSLPKVYRI